MALEAASSLSAGGTSVRVVSMPSWELLRSQGTEYRSSLLPDGVPVVSVEAGTTTGWAEYADASVGIDRFGASAPGSTVLRELGINPEHVAEVAAGLVASRS